VEQEVKKKTKKIGKTFKPIGGMTVEEIKKEKSSKT